MNCLNSSWVSRFGSQRRWSLSLPVLTLIFPTLLPCLVRDSLCTALQTKILWINWSLNAIDTIETWVSGNLTALTERSQPAIRWTRGRGGGSCVCPPPPPTIRPVCFDPLVWSSGSDQRRISGCGIRWLLAGPDSLPLWLCRVCAFVLLRCFSCSHTVLPKEHSLGIIFFSSLSSCKCCIFLQFYLHFTTDYTCMIVYVTNNKEPRTLNLWIMVLNYIHL